MPKYKVVNIIFFSILQLSILSYIFILPEMIYVIIPLILIYIFLLAYGSIDFRMMYYIKTVYSKKTDEKVIAISFDDGPADKTEQILEILKKYDIKAAFFLVGEKIEKYKNVIQKIDGEGHLIGNHSYTHHFWFDMFSSKRMKDELNKTEEIIENSISKKVKLFRPPYGVTNPSLRKAILKMNYTSVGWSLKSRDTVIKNGNKIEKRLQRKLKPGSVVLFHDTSQEIVDVLKYFINYALQSNYRIIRLDELLNIKPYEEIID
jgi:peptidoglycan-N-acetylglucosamine deacetylase